MERADWTEVAHDGIDLMNPLPVAKLDEVVELLALEHGARVIDLGCGKGELLRRLRHAVRDPRRRRRPLADAARRRHAAARRPASRSSSPT